MTRGIYSGRLHESSTNEDYDRKYAYNPKKHYTMDIIYGKNRKPIPLPENFTEPYYNEINEIPKGEIAYFRNKITGVLMLVDRTDRLSVIPLEKEKI